MDKRYNFYHLQKRVRRQWLTVLVAIVVLTYISQPVQTPVSPSPCGGCILPTVTKVQAVEPIVEPIEAKIREVFGKDAEEALKIAKCESQRDGKLQPEIVGDQHLMVMNNGELVGDSIGIFQVRTGGKGWNRAKTNGMTADEFRTKLKDYNYNIEYAKTIFDNAGDWTPWFNCMKKVL